MMSAFLTCYLWWLLAGFLLGWLCNWLLCRCCGKCNDKATSASAQPLMAGSANAHVSPAAAFADPVIDRAAAKLAGISVKGADDLEVIEGIGPKICGLFHAAGFKTFTQVSQMSIAQMSSILDAAGSHFRLANPETWAAQAKLAANNRWVELKTLQDNLTAGVTTQQDRQKL